MIRLTILWCLLLCGAFGLWAQQPTFSSKVSYRIESAGSGTTTTGSMMPTAMELFFNDSQIRVEIGMDPTVQMEKMVALMPKAGVFYLLTQFMGANMAFQGTPEDFKGFMKQQPTDVTFKKTDSVKTCAGIRCTKYAGQFMYHGKQRQVVSWVADSIVFKGQDLLGIKTSAGSLLPMEWTVESDGYSMHYVATSFEALVPSAGLFVLPEDATILPISMIKSMLPGR